MANNSKTSKIDRNREKVIQDRLQLLLTRMLQDEDNKYCVDCDSKGPRWASWNLGIFLCIRCAGIHRNLGVHISKVKSVNLDSWTQIQVSSMQQMGNSRGRAVYEARLPEDFRRPQSDQPMDTFIRGKYEKKKYIALEWTPTKPPDLPQGCANDNSSATTNSSAKAQLPSASQNSTAFDLLGLNSETNSSAINNLASLSTAQKLPQPSTNKLPSNLDLLCIGESTKTSNDNDFDDFVGAPATSNSSTTNGSNNNGQFSSNSNDLEQLGSAFASSSTAANEKETSGLMSKDSIMALFNKPQSGPSSTPNPMHISSNGVGQPAFTGYPVNLQTQPRPFNMNINAGVPMAAKTPSIASTSMPVGINFQQQPIILGSFGSQQQPPAISNLNNPFLSNLSSPAVNTASTSNSNQTSWGFMN